MRGAGALLNGDKPDWLISDSPDSGRVLTPANPRKDREHLYIASRVLAICFRTRGASADQYKPEGSHIFWNQQRA